jgi:hypothetical protein
MAAIGRAFGVLVEAIVVILLAVFSYMYSGLVVFATLVTVISIVCGLIVSIFPIPMNDPATVARIALLLAYIDGITILALIAFTKI